MFAPGGACCCRRLRAKALTAGPPALYHQPCDGRLSVRRRTNALACLAERAQNVPDSCHLPCATPAVCRCENALCTAAARHAAISRRRVRHQASGESAGEWLTPGRKQATRHRTRWTRPVPASSLGNQPPIYVQCPWTQRNTGTNNGMRSRSIGLWATKKQVVAQGRRQPRTMDTHP